MDFLQQIGPNLVIWLVVGCGLLCVGGVVLFVVLQFLGFGFDILFTALSIVGNVLTGGPIAWCGCMVFICGFGVCAIVTWALVEVVPNCGTSEALNVCRFLGQ